MSEPKIVNIDIHALGSGESFRRYLDTPKGRRALRGFRDGRVPPRQTAAFERTRSRAWWFLLWISSGTAVWLAVGFGVWWFLRSFVG